MLTNQINKISSSVLSPKGVATGSQGKKAITFNTATINSGQHAKEKNKGNSQYGATQTNSSQMNTLDTHADYQKIFIRRNNVAEQQVVDTEHPNVRKTVFTGVRSAGFLQQNAVTKPALKQKTAN